jgi:hypothetical protein
MNKKTLIGSIITVAVLVGVSFTSTVGQNDKNVIEEIPTKSFLIGLQNITGGFGVHAEIVSGTNEDLQDVGWRITLRNGGLILIGKKRTGDIGTLLSGARVKIWSFVFGIFGRGIFCEIRVIATYGGDDIEERIAIGEVIGPFVRNVFVDPP